MEKFKKVAFYMPKIIFSNKLNYFLGFLIRIKKFFIKLLITFFSQLFYYIKKILCLFNKVSILK